MDPSVTSIATAEFLAVDVETNGLSGDGCELTEVGAVLVGGGELHDRFDSLVRVARPLSRGIERLTGITQAMVDSAPDPEAVLPRLAELLDGRILVAHSASFDSRVLAQAFDRVGIEWVEPPTICTVALARRFAPLVSQRRLVPLAESLGIEVDGAHRALVDAETCARVFCALLPKLCASAQTVADALEQLASRRARRRGSRRGGRPPARRRSPDERPDLGALPDDPGVYIFRDLRGRPLYVGKSVAVRSRARAHFCAPSAPDGEGGPAPWTERAEIVDYKPTNSELGALVLENRLIKQWRPAGNVKLKRSDGYVYLRARLDIAFPVLEVAGEPAPGRAINVGPLRGRAAAIELADQLNSLFGLRHCGRKLKLRPHPSAYGQMGRCLSPCLGDLDPNLYRRRLDEALGHFAAPGGGELLIDRLDAQLREASAARHYERAAVLLRRKERLAALVDRLGGLLEALHARSRLVVARHPLKPRFDAFWIVDGRVVDWGPLPDRQAVFERTLGALDAARPKAAASRLVAPEEVDEIRIVHGWLATHEPPALALHGPPAARDLSAWLDRATAAAQKAPSG